MFLNKEIEQKYGKLTEEELIDETRKMIANTIISKFLCITLTEFKFNFILVDDNKYVWNKEENQ